MSEPQNTNNHLHIYNLRGFCWCGAHRDDWLCDEDLLEIIGKAFQRLSEQAREQAKP